MSETVILTRAKADNKSLRQALEADDDRVLELSCVGTWPISDNRPLAAALLALGPADRLVLTSRAGAAAVGEALGGRTFGAPVAVVGSSTLAAAREAGLSPDFVPSRADGGTLGRELPLPTGTVLLARSDRALPDLPALLRARGAEVREVTAYHTVTPAKTEIAEALAVLDRGAPIVVFASPSAVETFVELVGHERARRARPVAFGEQTAARARELIGSSPTISESTRIDSILAGIRELASAAS